MLFGRETKRLLVCLAVACAAFGDIHKRWQEQVAINTRLLTALGEEQHKGAVLRRRLRETMSSRKLHERT